MNAIAHTKKGSGQHPAVVEYRRKVESVAEHASAELDSLDEEIKRYLEQVKSDPPPKEGA